MFLSQLQKTSGLSRELYQVMRVVKSAFETSKGGEDKVAPSEKETSGYRLIALVSRECAACLVERALLTFYISWRMLHSPSRLN